MQLNFSKHHKAEKVPIPLDQAEQCPIEKALQTEVARAATKALHGRVNEQGPFDRSLRWLIRSSD